MRRFARNNGLSVVILGLFVLFLLGQALTGFWDHEHQQRMHGRPTESFGSYLQSAHFFEAVFENWESEFLAVASIAQLSVWFREHGSPESKPVAAPHDQTGG